MDPISFAISAIALSFAVYFFVQARRGISKLHALEQSRTETLARATSFHPRAATPLDDLDIAVWDARLAHAQNEKQLRVQLAKETRIAEATETIDADDPRLPEILERAASRRNFLL